MDNDTRNNPTKFDVDGEAVRLHTNVHELQRMGLLSGTAARKANVKINKWKNIHNHLNLTTNK